MKEEPDEMDRLWKMTPGKIVNTEYEGEISALKSLLKEAAEALDMSLQCLEVYPALKEKSEQMGRKVLSKIKEKVR